MIVFPNAKINIGLNIVDRLPNGYHSIQSIFYPIPWKDALEILPSGEHSFQSTGISIPSNGSRNLVEQAYDLLKADFDLEPISIHLHKNIPIGAGIGGGSADASFMLKMLNENYQLGISNQDLEIYAKRLGADCPFFIENKPKYVEGIGDEFSEIDLDLSGMYLVLINDGTHVSTQDAYANISPKKPQYAIQDIYCLPYGDWQDGGIVNDFEESVYIKYPHLRKQKEFLYNNGAIYASMTGSGSCHYGLFFEKPIFTHPDARVFLL